MSLGASALPGRRQCADQATMSALVFAHGERKATSKIKTDSVRTLKSLEIVFADAEEKLGIPDGTYDLFDAYGQVRTPADLQRAVRTAGAAECIIDVIEHQQFVRIKSLEAKCEEIFRRFGVVEDSIVNLEQRQDKKLQVATEDLNEKIRRAESKVSDEVLPAMQGLTKDKNDLQKDVRSIIEKLNSFNINELKDLSDNAIAMKEQVSLCVRRLNDIDTQWVKDKAQFNAATEKCSQDLVDLQKYVMGKLDILIEADADLRRDQQVSSERMQLVADDLRLLQEEHNRLQVRTKGALEESEELRIVLGQVREDNEHIRHENFSVSTRLSSLEGVASEKWQGFAPGVLYFRSFHRTAKGEDVQLSKDLGTATGRGFLAATGVVIGTDEGLCVGDGPCRHFGTPGCFSSYFEIQLDEIKPAPAGAGGLYVGVSIQSGDEIASHPHREFDGWLIGGHSKALICRAGMAHETLDAEKIPDTFAHAADDRAKRAAKDALCALRQALPPRKKGEVREVESVWKADELRMGDRVGVLFRCNRDGGARLRITVNGDVRATHNFLEAPPADAVQFLTPVIRLAGTGKSAKLMPGVAPPSRILADDM